MFAEDADSLHRLGLACLESGQPQAAAGLVSRAIQQREDVPAFYNTLGNALRALRRCNPAVLSFRKAISLEPEFAEAFANLGSALEESGQAVEAVACHRRAIELRPDCAEMYGNLGNALRSAGAPEEARAAYETALRLRPDYAEGWMNLGNLDFDGGRYARAAERYREALRLKPTLHAAKSNLGSALAQMGKHREAEAWCLEALRAMPNDAVAQSNLASVLAMSGRAEAAEQLCRQALAANPAMAEAHTNLGLALTRLHRFEEAEAHCRAALQLGPGRPARYANLARILTLTGRFDEAEACLRQALEFAPHNVCVLGCLGDLCAARLDYAGALEWYDRCEDMFRPARAMARLAIGDFERGWEEYESRWTLSDCPPPEFSRPHWDGRPFPGQTLLIHAEQGLGDTIQFVRFAVQVKPLGGRVVLACQRALLPLFSGIAGVDETVADDGPLPEFDCRVALLSLPRVLGCRENTIPRGVPYLTAPPEAAAVARRRLAEVCGDHHSRLRVGLVWAGNRKHPNDANRSMRLEQFEPLLAAGGAQFVSLQQGRPAIPGSSLLPLVLDDDPIDITAALVSELDLVITVDSMIAHLAGALARPVWTLLPFAPDWRWMTERGDSPWYPTMRLFRQPRFGAWDDVVARVAAVLRQSSVKTFPRRPDMDISGHNPVAAPAGSRKIQSPDRG